MYEGTPSRGRSPPPRLAGPLVAPAPSHPSDSGGAIRTNVCQMDPVASGWPETGVRRLRYRGVAIGEIFALRRGDELEECVACQWDSRPQPGAES